MIERRDPTSSVRVRVRHAVLSSFFNVFVLHENVFCWSSYAKEGKGESLDLL